MRKNLIAVLCIALTAVALTGCLTTSGKKEANDFKLKGAANSVFVYGSFLDKRGLLANQYDSMTFYQINPDMQPQILIAKTSSTQFYWIAKDVQPGGTFKLVYFAEGSGNTIYYATPGIQGKSLTDFQAPDKPGIYFAGLVEIKKTGATISRTPADELKILRAIPVTTAGDSWAPLLRARIKELEDEK
jgi:hypothetical protein